jgi:hypothetical protein
MTPASIPPKCRPGVAQAAAAMLAKIDAVGVAFAAWLKRYRGCGGLGTPEPDFSALSRRVGGGSRRANRAQRSRSNADSELTRDPGHTGESILECLVSAD